MRYATCFKSLAYRRLQSFAVKAHIALVVTDLLIDIVIAQNLVNYDTSQSDEQRSKMKWEAYLCATHQARSCE